MTRQAPAPGIRAGFGGDERLATAGRETPRRRPALDRRGRVGLPAAALLVGLSPHLLSDLLGFFAGTFLFIGVAHLLPESQREGEERVTILGVLLGFGFIALVTQVLHP